MRQLTKNLAAVALLAALPLGLWATSVLSAPKGSIITSAEICNPNAPTQCVAPDANGAITVVGTPGATSSAQTPIQGNGAGTTGAVVGTLSGAAAKTTYICGFNVSAIGGTAPVGPITVAGLNGGSQVYQMSSSAAGALLAQSFSPCIPASAANTAITITTTANGTATAVNVNSWGFRL